MKVVIDKLLEYEIGEVKLNRDQIILFKETQRLLELEIQHLAAEIDEYATHKPLIAFFIENEALAISNLPEPLAKRIRDILDVPTLQRIQLLACEKVDQANN